MLHCTVRQPWFKESINLYQRLDFVKCKKETRSPGRWLVLARWATVSGLGFMFACIAVKEWETHSSLTRIVRNEKYFWVVTVTRFRDFELVSGCSDVGGMTSPPAGPHLAAHTWRRQRSKHRENIREVADKRPSADVWPGGGNVAMVRGKILMSPRLYRGWSVPGVAAVWTPGVGTGPRWATSHRHITWQHGTKLLQRYTPHQTSVSKQYHCVQSMTNLPVCSIWRSACKSTRPRDTWQPRVRGSCDVAHL